jgi:hypothetical protein
MNRRDALGLLAGASIVPAFALESPVPQLHGDGIHDDAVALQAVIDGKRVRWPDGQIKQFSIDQPLFLDDAYLIRSRLRIDREYVRISCLEFRS